ncbi:MAG: thioredoxin domain-containing protein [Cyanobacteria bacterium P01_H01_bin.74]
MVNHTMPVKKRFLSKFIFLVFLSLILTLVLSATLPVSLPSQVANAKQDLQKGTIVAFTASWCASCREVVPVAKRMALDYHLNFKAIDVDAANAAQVCKAVGLNIPKTSPPVIYYVHKRKKRRLFTGDKSYHFGQTQQVRNAMVQSLPAL